MDEMYEDLYPYDDVEDNYEEIYLDEIDSSYFQDNLDMSYSLQNLWEDCLIPTLRDGIKSSIHLIICCLLLKFTKSLNFLPSYCIHLTSAATGLYCLYHFFEELIFYIIILAIIGYMILNIVHMIWKKYCGYTSFVVCFIFLIICELLIVNPTQWHRIRGSQMILAMKIISLGFDVDSSIKFPSLIECFGYYFCVGSVIFGPWVSYINYMKLLQERSMNKQYVFNLMKCLILSYLFLTMSTCWINWMVPYSSWSWISAYRDAFSFRTSHYFISYLSEVSSILCGISSSSNSWEMTVVSPFSIELPRSLVEVVIYWNIPMHYWLKTYVFKTARPFGKFVAVLVTYIASSLLHGMNFQLAAVLLSLGFYTYIEYSLRQKLSIIFDACILARKCKKDCNHSYKNYHPYVIIINLCFGILAMFHLSYLGVMFDTTSSVQEEGYNMNHTLHKWTKLNFASHWVAFATYIFNILV